MFILCLKLISKQFQNIIMNVAQDLASQPPNITSQCVWIERTTVSNQESFKDILIQFKLFFNKSFVVVEGICWLCTVSVIWNKRYHQPLLVLEEVLSLTFLGLWFLQTKGVHSLMKMMPMMVIIMILIICVPSFLFTESDVRIAVKLSM